ncbi:DNA-binding response regulator, partial [Psychrobacter sp. N25K4-3-2]|nr:DNA-binding response regulator [Psychrobacter sp. N25K4-3-2]
LRIKIDDEHEAKLIHTVRGMGYRLEAVDTVLDNNPSYEAGNI